jgi:hypothetical protein
MFQEIFQKCLGKHGEVVCEVAIKQLGKDHGWQKKAPEMAQELFC